MKEIKAFKSALNAASGEAAHMLTSQLRFEATASGWPSDVTNRMHVSHKDGSFDVHVHEKHHAKALDLEYGTPDTQPTAAIRRLSNRTSQAEHLIMGRMSKMLGDL